MSTEFLRSAERLSNNDGIFLHRILQQLQQFYRDNYFDRREFDSVKLIEKVMCRSDR